MRSRDADLAILGGGCAGLSIAARLVDTTRRVVVIEPRTAAPEDRNWSFWRSRPDLFDDCVRARWSRWSVSRGGAVARRRSEVMPYETVSSSRFYEKAHTLCAASANTDLRLGCAALGAPQYLDRADLWRVETSDGPLYARSVVDARAPHARPGYGQVFLGREVVFNCAAFDPTTVELMNFRSPRSDRVDFVYVLPFSADRALVEVTSFTEAAPTRQDLEDWLGAELDARAAGRGFEVLREEGGFIPMTTRPRRDFDGALGPRTVFAGLRGGAARASTGYAFQRIQSMADQIVAKVLADESDLRPRLDGPATRFMDGLFLKVVRRRPDFGPALFLRMFTHAPKDRLERFLSGSTAIGDRVAVISSLPPAPFLRQLATP